MNADLFRTALERHYVRLFRDDPEYAYSASRVTPADLATKMTAGLRTGAANKDGSGIKAACKELGIKQTYKAIMAYLAETTTQGE